MTGITIASGIKENNLYRLITEEAPEVHAASSKELPLTLWHQRLGYISVETIKKTYSGNLVIGLHVLKNEKTPFCEPCIEGKLHRLPFPKEAH